MATKRQLQKYMISRNGKVYNTEPERNFKEFARQHGLNVCQNVTLTFHEDGGEVYDFQCDFLVPTEEWFSTDFEIDGPYHETDRAHRKDLWKDFIKAKRGLKVIHVPAVLTEKKWWPYLDSEIIKALAGKSRSVFIAA